MTTKMTTTDTVILTAQVRLGLIERLECELELLGRFPVLSIDVADVSDHLDEEDDRDSGGFSPLQIHEIAARAAADLSENELALLPLSDAIRQAAADLYSDPEATLATKREGECHE